MMARIEQKHGVGMFFLSPSGDVESFISLGELEFSIEFSKEKSQVLSFQEAKERLASAVVNELSALEQDGVIVWIMDNE